jgi:hypothetical protein
MKEMLLLLNDTMGLSPAIEAVESEGGRVLQRYGQNVLVVQGDDRLGSVLGQHDSVQGVFTGPVPQEEVSRLDLSGSLGVSAWNERQTSSFSDAKANRPGAGLSWGHPDFEREG